jgi:hypothetical protein
LRVFATTFCWVILLSASRASAAADNAADAGWKAGVAAVKITPEKPVVLLGYTNRGGPFTGVEQDIYAKALALEDSAGRRAVIVTGDLVGFQGPFIEPVLQRIAGKL